MFSVIAGKAGVVKRTRDEHEARQVYLAVRDEAARGAGEFAFEGVQLLEGDRVVHESLPVYPYPVGIQF